MTSGTDAPSAGHLDFECGAPFPGGQQVMINIESIGNNVVNISIPAAFGFRDGLLRYKNAQVHRVLQGESVSLPHNLDDEAGYDVVTMSKNLASSLDLGVRHMENEFFELYGEYKVGLKSMPFVLLHLETDDHANYDIKMALDQRCINFSPK